MREVVLDTETTGLDPKRGDRVIEVGCVEIVNRVPTGREFHAYINPERDVPAEAVKVHGLTAEFLADKPVFARIVDGFLDFIGEAPLVIHNANFDMGFINFELSRVKKPEIGMERVIDTLALARRRNPGGPNSLDALCKRFNVDNTKRTKHGALLDAGLLAEVYLELLGERQATLALSRSDAPQTAGGAKRRQSIGARPRPLAPRLSAEDEAAHKAFVATLGASAVWLQYQEPDKS